MWILCMAEDSIALYKPMVMASFVKKISFAILLQKKIQYQLRIMKLEENISDHFHKRAPDKRGFWG